MVELIILYIVIIFITYIVLGYLVDSNIGIDREFDDLMSDNSVRMLALLCVSLIWPISIPLIIINNIFNKGEN